MPLPQRKQGQSDRPMVLYREVWGRARSSSYENSVLKMMQSKQRATYVGSDAIMEHSPGANAQGRRSTPHQHRARSWVHVLKVGSWAGSYGPLGAAHRTPNTRPPFPKMGLGSSLPGHCVCRSRAIRARETQLGGCQTRAPDKAG